MAPTRAMGLVLAAMTWSAAVHALEPEPGSAVIDGERYTVVVTAADRSDLDPELLPHMHDKCCNAGRALLEIAETQPFDGGSARLRAAHFEDGAVLMRAADLGAAPSAAAGVPAGQVRIDGRLFAFALAEDTPAFLREDLLPNSLATCQSKARDLLSMAQATNPERRALYGAFGAVAVTCTNLVSSIVDDSGMAAFEEMIEAVRDDLFVYTGDEPGGAAALARAVARMAAAGFDRAIVAVHPGDLPQPADAG